MVMETNQITTHWHTCSHAHKKIRSTQKSPTENTDGTNSEMILTNEVTIPAKHTESPDVDEEYMKLIYELTVSTEPSSSTSSLSSAWSPSSDSSDAYTIETDSTDPSSESSSRPKVINVISV